MKHIVALLVCLAVSLCSFIAAISWSMEHVQVFHEDDCIVLSLFGHEWVHDAQIAD